jgi:hypothetical protein
MFKEMIIIGIGIGIGIGIEMNNRTYVFVSLPAVFLPAGP